MTRAVRVGAACWLVVVAAGCQPAEPVVNPDDPAVVAAIDSIMEQVRAGAAAVDADRVLAPAEGAGEFTFVTGDVALAGLDPIREQFRKTYGMLERQDQTILERRIRVLSPTVAIVYAVGEGTYTDKAGWTSEPVGLGYTLVFVREGGEWRIRHAHQSVAP